MLFLAGCLGLTGMMYLTLRGGLIGHGATQIQGFDTTGLWLGAVSLAAAIWVFGSLYGLAIVLSIMIHEFGHVAAFRIAGHDDARFRLIPLLGGVAISDTPPRTQADDFFITIMGPAICLAPMVLALALMEVVWPYSVLAEEFLWVFAITTGALNFFNLLPFWPLDGGRCVRILTDTFMPRATWIVTVAMSATFAALGVALQSIVITLLALLAAQSLFGYSAISLSQARMGRTEGLVALAAYVFTAGAHFWGGYAMIVRYF